MVWRRSVHYGGIAGQESISQARSQENSIRESKGGRAEVAANHGLRVGKKWKCDDFGWQNREGEEACGKKTGGKKIR
jgi:hypothetical protein